jgi:tripartite-type tricarboxylate transporter receptor subunit TctC
MRKFIVFGASIVLLAFTATAGFAQDVSFAGEKVRIIMNGAMGSNTGIILRQLLPYIEKHLPGKPEVLLEEKPGGAGLLAANYMARNAKPDGHTMALLSSFIFRIASGRKIKFPPTDLNFVGATGTSVIVYTRNDANMKTADDFKKGVIVGTSTPTSASILPIRLFLNAIGATNHKRVVGYRGQLKILKAARSNEINTGFMADYLWLPRRSAFERENLFTGVMEFGHMDASGKIHKTPGVNLPLVDEEWRRLAPDTVGSDAHKAARFFMKARAGIYAFVTPPGTPEKFTQAWESAVKNAYEDPEYLAQLDKNNIPHPVWLSGPDMTKLIKEAVDMTKDEKLQAAVKVVAK